MCDDYYKLVQLKDFPSYMINKAGIVYSIKRDKLVKQTVCKDGYLKVNIRENGIYHENMLVHRLVAYNFNNIYNNNFRIVHLNDNKLDNSLSNLWIYYP